MKYLLGLLFIAFSVKAFSQKESLYVFDKDWKQTDVKKAVFILQVLKFSDTQYRWSYYYMFGPMIKFITTKDGDGEIPHGRTVFYDEKGRMDSVGEYVNGLRNGDWGIVNDTGGYSFIRKYEMGKLISEKEIIHLQNDQKEKLYDDEKESEFPGGISGWSRFLNKNLRYPERAINIERMGEVRISFVIKKEGQVEDSFISQSVEYSLDAEAMRIIRITPKWIPAFQNGKYVKSYKVQPIVFRLED